MPYTHAEPWRSFGFWGIHHKSRYKEEQIAKFTQLASWRNRPIQFSAILQKFNRKWQFICWRKDKAQRSRVCLIVKICGWEAFESDLNSIQAGKNRSLRMSPESIWSRQILEGGKAIGLTSNSFLAAHMYGIFLAERGRGGPEEGGWGDNIW